MTAPGEANLSDQDAEISEQVRSCSLEVVDRISGVQAREWDECAGSKTPFTRHAHLSALETSGSASPETGFKPSHLILRDPSGRIAAAAPTYIKSHSDAEIGSDMGWSMAHERFCGPYYPKLQIEVPLTPNTGPRLLTRHAPCKNALRKRLLLELLALAERLKLSSAHVTYMTEEERNLAVEVGMLPDKGTSFVWENNNYQDFSRYTGSMRKNRRGTINRERRVALEGGLEIDLMTGDDLTTSHADLFYELYINTYKKYENKHFLTRAYFESICRNMPQDLLLILARRGDDYIAGTWTMLSAQTVSIQHWGAREDVKFLHFETTYYQAIDYALAHGQGFIDMGPIGKKKAARGFLPTDVYHAHWFRNPDFGKLISKGLEKKSRVISEEQATLMQNSPYRSEGG